MEFARRHVQNTHAPICAERGTMIMAPATWSQLRHFGANAYTIHLSVYEQNSIPTCDVVYTLQILNLRGGGPEDKNRNEISYLTNIKFQWNGLPMIDFIEKIIYPLNMGLGSVSLGKHGRTCL